MASLSVATSIRPCGTVDVNHAEKMQVIVGMPSQSDTTLAEYGQGGLQSMIAVRGESGARTNCHIEYQVQGRTTVAESRLPGV